MPAIESLSHVGIFTRDQDRAKAFYTRRVGLKLREHKRVLGYLALGPTKAGEDASLNVWKPDPATWGAEYAPSVGQIGQVTGIGFTTMNLDESVSALLSRNVRAEILGEQAGERYARFFDADGNMLFLIEPPKPKVRRAGLAAMDFVTIVTRNVEMATEFFRSALGMRVRRSRKEDYVECRLGPRGTALAPFTPRREDYYDSKNYNSVMAHLGENTWIFFTTHDILAAQERMLDLGVRFRRKAEPGAWAGMLAEFMDPDGNVYGLVQKGAAKPSP